MLTEIVSLNKTPDDNHFSYEDMGLLSLHFYLCVGMTTLLALMIKQYYHFFMDFDRYIAPHPIMIYALGS